MKYFLLYLFCYLFFPYISHAHFLTKDSIAEKFRSYPTLCLLDSTYVHVSENGSATFLIHRSIKIQKPNGTLKYRILKYDYDPLTAFAAFKYAFIRKTNGDTLHLNPAQTYDYTAPARAIYWGARQIMLEIGRLNTGDIIEYEIEKKGFTYALLSDNSSEDERFVPPMRGQFYDIVPFWTEEPTLRKVYQITLPATKNLRYQFYQGECNASQQSFGTQTTYSFDVNGILPFQREPNMVDLYDAAPKLMMSTTEDWPAKSRWFYRVNEEYGSFDPTPSAQAKVEELLKEAKNEMEKISILTHWVADNMRYSGISMGKGEGYTLHNTQTNFTDRCGVCKDKAALLISMLRMAGFEAYPAMTMAGSRVEEIPADHFNHSVAVVKLSNGTYMPLDPTWVPFIRELWSSAEQQQHYLPGLPEGSDLILTPLSPPENHYFRLYVSSKLDKRGNLKGELSVEAEGQSDGSIRRIFTSGFQRDWKNKLEKELLQISPQARLLQTDYGTDPRDYPSAPIRIKMKFYIPGFAIAGENTLTFKPVVFSHLFSNVRTYLRILTDLETRKYGFRDACSRFIELQENIRLPKGYQMIQNHREDRVESPVASFSGSLQQKEQQLILMNKLSLGKRVYKAEDWPAFREAVNRHKSYGSVIIVQTK